MIRTRSTDRTVFAAVWRRCAVAALALLALVGLTPRLDLAAAVPAARPGATGESLAILPHTIVLRGPKARQAILVERQEHGRGIGQVTEGVVIESSNVKVV